MMNTKNVTLAGLLGLALAGFAAAQDQPAPGAAPAPGGQNRRQMPPEMRERMLKEFDKDGDGKLSDEERAAAREASAKAREAALLKEYDKDGDGKLSDEEKAAIETARKAREKEMLDKYDTDKDGKLSPEERRAMMEARQKEMLTKYDKDGDGKLNEEERAAARKDMPPMFFGRPPGGRGGRGDAGGGSGGGAGGGGGEGR